MKIEDLRVGNHLFSNEVSGVVEVSGISKDIIQFEHKGSILYDCVSRFQSVKLTEEILLNKSFKKYGKYHYSYKLGLFIIEEQLLNSDKYLLRKRINKQESLILRDIEYLHELQNIIYYLTKKEL